MIINKAKNIMCGSLLLTAAALLGVGCDNNEQKSEDTRTTAQKINEKPNKILKNSGKGMVFHEPLRHRLANSTIEGFTKLWPEHSFANLDLSGTRIDNFAISGRHTLHNVTLDNRTNLNFNRKWSNGELVVTPTTEIRIGSPIWKTLQEMSKNNDPANKVRVRIADFVSVLEQVNLDLLTISKNPEKLPDLFQGIYKDVDILLDWLGAKTNHNLGGKHIEDLVAKLNALQNALSQYNYFNEERQGLGREVSNLEGDLEDSDAGTIENGQLDTELKAATVAYENSKVYTRADMESLIKFVPHFIDESTNNIGLVVDAMEKRDRKPSFTNAFLQQWNQK